jgi:ABC-type multidrug transport system ATPase subunit
MSRPKLLMLDEPSLGLSPILVREIFEIIKRLNNAGTTVVMITHRIDYAAAYAERVIVMQRGRVAFDGPAHELLQNQELMQANSLDLPQTTRLAVELSPYGVPPWLVTVEQLEQAVRSLVEDANGR